MRSSRLITTTDCMVYTRTPHTTPNKFHQIVDETIALAQSKTAQIVEAYANREETLPFILREQAVHVAAGRQVGKTSYILKNVTPWDVVILPTQQSLQSMQLMVSRNLHIPKNSRRPVCYNFSNLQVGDYYYNTDVINDYPIGRIYIDDYSIFRDKVFAIDRILDVFRHGVDIQTQIVCLG